MITDPIADMLTRIRNASAVKKPEVTMPYSRLKHEIANVLVAESYLAKAERVDDERLPSLRVVLKYRTNGRPYIKHLKRLSVPSRRLYVPKDRIPRALNGYGTVVLSSSHGILTNKQARRVGVGGELLLEIW